MERDRNSSYMPDSVVRESLAGEGTVTLRTGGDSMRISGEERPHTRKSKTVALRGGEVFSEQLGGQCGRSGGGQEAKSHEVTERLSAGLMKA